MTTHTDAGIQTDEESGQPLDEEQEQEAANSFGLNEEDVFIDSAADDSESADDNDEYFSYF